MLFIVLTVSGETEWWGIINYAGPSKHIVDVEKHWALKVCSTFWPCLRRKMSHTCMGSRCSMMMEDLITDSPF